ncbi:MAG: hypothetical protein AAB489_03615, partial [Patescibacteria group bacterium]
MRIPFFLILFGLITLSPSQTASAARFSVQDPVKFEEIEKMTTETIPENLRATQCGGWDTN